MAQAGFVLSDEGRTITAVNDSGTTTITAGDPVYSAANDDKFTGTAASARAAYAYNDIKVKSLVCSATGYQTPIGVALTDAASTDGAQLTVALEGVFLHPVNSDTEAGDPLQFDASTSQKVDTLGQTITFSSTGTTATVAMTQYKVGRALTGGSADGKYIAWKLTL